MPCQGPKRFDSKETGCKMLAFCSRSFDGIVRVGPFQFCTWIADESGGGLRFTGFFAAGAFDGREASRCLMVFAKSFPARAGPARRSFWKGDRFAGVEIMGQQPIAKLLRDLLIGRLVDQVTHLLRILF